MKRKLFISMPVEGRTQKNVKNSIAKMKAIAEACYNEEFEVLNTYNDTAPVVDGNEKIFCLAKSLELLSQADVYITLFNTGHYYFRQAEEFSVARKCMPRESVLEIDAAAVAPDLYKTSVKEVNYL